MTTAENKASGRFPDPHASAGASADAHTCANDLAKHASVRKMSAVIRRGPHNPATAKGASQPRGGLRQAWRSVAGETTAQSAERWAMIDSHGPKQEAARRSWGEIPTHLREWLISTPAYLEETGWKYLNDSFRDTQRR